MANSPQTDTSPSAKQLVFLAMMATVVAVVVFLCGVLVGRGVPARGMLGAAVDSGLGSGVGPGLERGVGGADPETSPLDDLSYYGRLNDDAPSAVAPEPAASDSAAADSETSDPSAPAPSAADTPIEPATADATGDTPVPAVPDLPQALEAAYMVQVTALRDRDEARAIANRLQGGGYSAIVVNPPDGAEVGLFRVRVGPFADRAGAEDTRRRLEADEGYTTWVIEP